MRKIIVVIIVAMISSFSYYGKVNKNGERIIGIGNTLQEGNNQVNV